MSEPARKVLFTPLGWVLVASALVLLVWSTLAYRWSTVEARGLLLVTLNQQPVATNAEGLVTAFHENSDFLVYYTNLGWIDQGHLLFDHGYAEYPPFGLMYVNWPQFITHSFVPFSWWLWFTNALLYLGIAWLTWQLGRLLGRTPTRTWWWWLLPSVVYYSLNRFDVLPVFLLALSLYLMLTNRLRSGWLVYGLSIMTKLYPLFLLPLALTITRERGHTLRSYWPYLLVPIVSLTGAMAQVGGWPATVYPYLLQFIRSNEAGSVSAVLAAVWPIGMVYLATVFKLGQLAVPAWWYWRTLMSKNPLSLSTSFTLSALTLLLSIFFNTFYSNQWWVWVVPFLILILPPSAAVLVVAHDLLNYLQFPVLHELVSGTTFHVEVAVRSIVLLALIVVVWRQLPRQWWKIT